MAYELEKNHFVYQLRDVQYWRHKQKECELSLEEIRNKLYGISGVNYETIKGNGGSGFPYNLLLKEERLQKELEVCQERLNEVEQMLKKFSPVVQKHLEAMYIEGENHEDYALKNHTSRGAIQGKIDKELQWILKNNR